MKYLSFFLLLSLPLGLYGQFFYPNQTVPQSKYIVSETGSGIELGENMPLNSVDSSFTLALWFNASEYDCDDVLVGTDDVKVSLIKSNKQYKVRFSIKDSLVIESSRFDANWSDLLQSAHINSHIAVTYSGSNTIDGMSIYVNGDEIETDAVSSVAVSLIESKELSIGAPGCNIKYYNISAYNEDLNASQISTLSSRVDFQIGTPDVYAAGSEKYKQSGFFDNVFQKWKIPATGRVVSVPVWGEQKDIGGNYEYQSPFGGFFLGPYVIYDRFRNKSFMATTARGGPGFSRDVYLCEFDHVTKNFQINSKASAGSGLVRNDHTTGVIAINNDSTILIVREERHNDPMFAWKVSYPHAGNIDTTSSVTPGNNTAYPYLFNLGTSTYVIARDYVDETVIAKTTNGGETWGSIEFIAKCLPSDWMYHKVEVHDDSVAYLMLNNRNQSGAGNWDYLYALKTLDGEIFCNLDSTRCENVTSGQWDSDELRKWAAIDSTTNGTSSVFPWVSLVDNEDRFHILYYNGQSDTVFHYMEDGGVLTNDFFPFPVSSRMELVHKGGDNFDLFYREDRSGKATIVKYQTTDNLQTFDGGEVIYQGRFSGLNGIDRFTVTKNHRQGEPIIFSAVVNLDFDKEQTGLFIYEYNPN